MFRINEIRYGKHFICFLPDVCYTCLLLFLWNIGKLFTFLKSSFSFEEMKDSYAVEINNTDTSQALLSNGSISENLSPIIQLGYRRWHHGATELSVPTRGHCQSPSHCTTPDTQSSHHHSLTAGKHQSVLHFYHSVISRSHIDILGLCQSVILD